MKKIDQKHNLIDYMGRTELAANLFKIALTKERLKKQMVNNENLANHIHLSVGKDVRAMVYSNTGMNPENLPIDRRLDDVKKELKKANKKLTSSK